MKIVYLLPLFGSILFSFADPKGSTDSLRDARNNYLDSLRNYNTSDLLYKKIESTYFKVIFSCVAAILAIMTIFQVESLKEIHLALANGFSLQATMFMFLKFFNCAESWIFFALTVGIGIMLTFIPATKQHVSILANMGIGSLFILIILNIAKGYSIYIVMVMYYVSLQVLCWFGIFESIFYNIIFSTSSTYFCCITLSFCYLDVLEKALGSTYFNFVHAIAKAVVLAILLFFVFAPFLFSLAFGGSSKKTTP